MSTFKSLLEKQKLSKILKGLICILLSLYLTAYLNQFTLDSIWSNLPVFVCFIAVSVILLQIVSRVFLFVSRPKTVLLTIAIAVLILIGYRDVFLPFSQEVFITLTSETTGEICLCDVVVDGENIPVAEVEVVENSGWLYREKYDNFMIWLEEDGIENCLTMRFHASEIHLGFPYTPYAGSVTITSSNGDDATWNLQCPVQDEGEAVEYADIFIECRRDYSIWEILLYGAGALVIIASVCQILFYTAGLICRKSRIQLENSAVQNSEPNLDKQDYREIFVSNRLLLQSEQTQGRYMYGIYGIFSFILACVIVLGNKINVHTEPYFESIAFRDFLYVTLYFFVIFMSGNILLIVTKRFLSDLQMISIRKRWWLSAFLLLVLLWLPYLFIYYPGILTEDSFTSLLQAKDLSLLYNHIPVMYTLVVAFWARIGWTVGNSNLGVFLFSLVQLLTMAGVLSYITYWIRMKIKKAFIAWAVLLFYGLNPVVAMYSITMWKDVLFSAWITLLCLFLFEIALADGKILEERKKLRQLCILFAMVSFGRNNGIYVVVICWIALLAVYKHVRNKIIFWGGATILAVLLIQGPGYRIFGIERSGFAESVGIPLQQISYVVVYDEPLEESEKAFLEKIIPIEAIKESYSPVSVDSIKFNTEFNTSFFEQNKAEFLKLYISLFPKYLNSYVKAYLLSTSGFWKIEATGWLISEEICENDMDIYHIDRWKEYTNIEIKERISDMLTCLRQSPITNVGVMVWLVFLYIIVCFGQRQSWKIYLALPMIACWMTIMLATPVYAQFRYMYYYHLMLPVVCIMFFMRREENQK